MDFKIFRSECKHMKMGCDTYMGHDFYPTCRREDRIPPGDSWAICDQEHCPYYEVVVKTNADKIRIMTDEEMAKYLSINLKDGLHEDTILKWLQQY